MSEAPVRLVYSGFDSSGDLRFGPLVAGPSKSQLCTDVSLEVTTMTVDYQDESGTRLNQAILRGVRVVPGATVTVRAFDSRIDPHRWTARAPYASDYSPFSHSVGICYGDTSPRRGTVLDDLNTMTGVDGFKMIHIYHLFRDDLTIDPTREAVLQYAQANGIEVFLGTRNVVAAQLLQTPAGAATYVAAIQPYLSAIKAIAPGNEVNDRRRANIDPDTFRRAVTHLRAALADAGYPETPITVSLQYGGLTSYPPGGASFVDTADARSMQGYVEAIRSVNTKPFVFVNLHPSYTVEDVVGRFPSLAAWFPMFGLFTSTVDPATNDPKQAPFWSLFDLQYNTVLTAMQNAGINGVQVYVGESGWPSAGGGPYATSENQAGYLSGLLSLWVRPQVLANAPGIPTFLFEAFDEFGKGQGQASWGLRTESGAPKPGVSVRTSSLSAKATHPRPKQGGAAAAPLYTLTFADTFADLTQWTVESIKDPAGSPTEYTQKNVKTVPGGGVRIVVTRGRQRSNGEWIAQSGRLRSNFRQKYGLFLFGVRQIPKGADASSPLRHLWPALWTVGPVDDKNVWPSTGEIDMMETILSAAQRADFTSRLMIRSNLFPPDWSHLLGDWFASVPEDASPDIKTFLTAAQWKQPHTFAVDWVPVSVNGSVTDVRYDFYLDVEVSADGRLVRRDGTATAPTPLHSYSLKQLTQDHNRSRKPLVPDWQTLDREWGAHCFVLNVCVGGAWDPNLSEIKKGTWQPPTDGSADMIVDYVKAYQRAR